MEIKAAYDDVNGRIIAGKKSYDDDRATFARTKDPELAKSLAERGNALKALLPELAEKQKRFQEVSTQIVAVDKQGSALERALDAKLPFRKAPTVYGRTAIGESFADSLALFKLDRAALERAAPGSPRESNPRSTRRCCGRQRNSRIGRRGSCSACVPRERRRVRRRAPDGDRRRQHPGMSAPGLRFPV